MAAGSLKTVAAKSVIERRFSALFVLLLAYLVLYPYGHPTGRPLLAFRIFGICVTVLSVYAVSFRRGFAWFATALAFPTLVQRILLPQANAGALPLATIVLGLSFDVFIIAVLFHRVFVQEEPTKETIFGALCIYLLMGFGFSSLYGMVATIQPEAFYLDPSLNQHTVPDRFDFIYYSFGTLTCMGGGGITPLSQAARSISVIEALSGVLYLAVLISRLLTAYHSRAAAARDGK